MWEFCTSPIGLRLLFNRLPSRICFYNECISLSSLSPAQALETKYWSVTIDVHCYWQDSRVYEILLWLLYFPQVFQVKPKLQGKSKVLSITASFLSQCFVFLCVFFLMDCSKLNLKSNYKSSDMLTGMSTTESTTRSPAHFLFHWMIRTFNTVGSNIIYKSCTGCFILFSVRMSSLITGYSF